MGGDGTVARGRTRRVLVGGVTRPSRLRALRALRVRSRAPHVPKDSREGREEEVLTVMNDLTLEARRTRPGTGELPREAVRGLWEYQIPWSTTPGAPRWCDRPRVQPPGGELSCEGGRCPPRSRGESYSAAARSARCLCAYRACRRRTACLHVQALGVIVVGAGAD